MLLLAQQVSETPPPSAKRRKVEHAASPGTEGDGPPPAEREAAKDFSELVEADDVDGDWRRVEGDAGKAERRAAKAAAKAARRTERALEAIRERG